MLTESSLCAVDGWSAWCTNRADRAWSEMVKEQTDVPMLLSRRGAICGSRSAGDLSVQGYACSIVAAVRRDDYSGEELPSGTRISGHAGEQAAIDLFDLRIVGSWGAGLHVDVLVDSMANNGSFMFASWCRVASQSVCTNLLRLTCLCSLPLMSKSSSKA